MGWMLGCERCVWFHPRWQPNVTKREEQPRSQNWPWHTMLFSKCTPRRAAPGKCHCRGVSVALQCQTSWGDSHHGCGTTLETLGTCTGEVSPRLCLWVAKEVKETGKSNIAPTGSRALLPLGSTESSCMPQAVQSKSGLWKGLLVMWEKSNRFCIASRGFVFLDIDRRAYAISSAQLQLIPLYIHLTKKKEWCSTLLLQKKGVLR